MRFRGLAEATAVVLAAVALTSVLTYPLAFKIDRVGRLNTDDGRWSIWVVSWVAHALTTDPAGVFQANIFYPQRNALAFSEANLVEGAIGAPVWALTGNPYATHNVVALFSFILAFAGAYYLVRYLTGHRGAAAVAGSAVRLLPVRVRADGAHPADVHRRHPVLPARLSSAGGSRRRCSRARALGLLALAAGARMRVLRHLRRR